MQPGQQGVTGMLQFGRRASQCKVHAACIDFCIESIGPSWGSTSVRQEWCVSDASGPLVVGSFHQHLEPYVERLKV